MIEYYAGIGSRDTPEDALEHLRNAARRLALAGYGLRSGGAPGADLACEDGCDDVNGQKQIFLPWIGFAERERAPRPPRAPGTWFFGAPDAAYELAARTHPAWDKCQRGARQLHARNGLQMLGPDMTDLSKFVMCWTKNGSGAGGTGQAIRIAKHYKVPIYDLGRPNGLDELNQFLEGLLK